MRKNKYRWPSHPSTIVAAAKSGLARHTSEGDDDDRPDYEAIDLTDDELECEMIERLNIYEEIRDDID